MPDKTSPPTKPNPKVGADELEAAIDALLAEINATCTRFENPQAENEDEDLAEYARAMAAVAKPSSTQTEEPPTPEAEPEPTAGPSDEPGRVGEDAEAAIDDAKAAAVDLLEQAADELMQSLEAGMPEGPEAEPAPDAEAAHEPEPEAGEPPAAGAAEPDSTEPPSTEPEPVLPEVAAATEPDAQPDPAIDESEAPGSAHAAEDLLASAVEELLQESAEMSGPEPEEHSDPAPEAVDGTAEPEPAASAFADLDAALDDLLDGTFESAAGEAVDTAGMDTRPDPSLMLDAADGEPQEDGSEASASLEPESEPVPQPQVQPEPSPAAASEPADPSPEPVAPSEPVPVRTPEPRREPLPSAKGRTVRARVFDLLVTLRVWAAPHLRAAGGAVLAAAKPLAARGLMAMSKPLEGKPPGVRDSIGWVALWTLFLAICVWATLLLRTPDTPPARSDASAMVAPEAPAP